MKKKYFVYYVTKKEFHHVKKNGWNGLIDILQARNGSLANLPHNFYYCGLKNYQKQILIQNANGLDLLLRSTEN